LQYLVLPLINISKFLGPDDDSDPIVYIPAFYTKPDMNWYSRSKCYTRPVLLAYVLCFSDICRVCRRAKRTKPEDGMWDCSVCTYKNSAEAFKCAMCDVRKGTSTR